MNKEESVRAIVLFFVYFLVRNSCTKLFGGEIK